MAPLLHRAAIKTKQPAARISHAKYFTQDTDRQKDIQVSMSGITFSD